MDKNEESEYLKTKKAFREDCKQDNLFPLEDETSNEIITDNLDDLRIVQQYQSQNRDKKPVFH